MNFALVCLLAVVVTVPFGAAFVLLPEVIAGQYGIVGWTPGTLVVARLFGAELLFAGMAAFAVRDVIDRHLQARIATCFSVASLLPAIVSAHGAATGAVNSLGWSTPVLYACFAAAWASIALRQRR